MPLTSAVLPNKPLNGHELLDVLVAKFRQSMERDCLFSPGIVYGRVAAVITMTVQTSNMAVPRIQTRTYKKVGDELEDLPLAEPGEDAQVVAKEVSVRLENPNLERVHAGLPIVVEGRRGTGPATPGDPFPAIDRHEVRYDTAQYPEASVPVVADVSVREASLLGVPVGPVAPLPPAPPVVSGEPSPPSIDPAEDARNMVELEKRWGKRGRPAPGER